MYDVMMELAENKNSELYDSYGFKRRGASHHNAFWDGYDGLNSVWIVPESLGYACWRAGQNFRKMQDKK